ncbi:ABC transporter substrate-binding protein [Loktanella sp. IMCC34160]|uniref:MlaC/ttg2D family ABC transporter substrate-binding protein n=1 Tax=Loktanella sp. IMCC34160 TaxID=2510646 RepID=UPI00101D3F27|nr:ABC transporter substrate-binding protein [Loktanella sp. IMCC34160]RYG91285.1 ABC transporter substrate-binding protein [Loktanella sp. IMCC34160]
MTLLNRRNMMIAAAAAAVLPAPVFAVGLTEAERLVDRLVADINAVIASGRSEAAMIQDFEGIFARYSDVEYIAGTALGRDARTATPAQRSAFVAAFQKYISNRYGKRFREFIGGEITVVQARQVNNFIEVETVANLRGQAPFRVDFWVSDRLGRPAFFNIIIEGVNMLNQERSEIGAMLDQRRGNLDALIADLQRI